MPDQTDFVVNLAAHYQSDVEAGVTKDATALSQASNVTMRLNASTAQQAASFDTMATAARSNAASAVSYLAGQIARGNTELDGAIQLSRTMAQQADTMGAAWRKATELTASGNAQATASFHEMAAAAKGDLQFAIDGLSLSLKNNDGEVSFWTELLRAAQAEVESFGAVTAQADDIVAAGNKKAALSFSELAAAQRANTSEAIGKLALALQSGVGDIDALTAAAAREQKVLMEVEAAQTAANKATADASGLAALEREQMDALSASMVKVGEATRLSAVATRGLAESLLLSRGNALLAALAVGAEAVRSFSTFQNLMVETRNNTQMTSAQFLEMKKTIEDLARSSPASLEELAAGYRHISDAGYRGADAALILKVAMESAVSTGASVADVANTLGAVMRAFNLNASQAAHAMDVLHATANAGNLTLEQTTQVFGVLGSYASAIGVPMEDVGAALATMTRRGMEATTAATQIKDAMIHIVAPTKQARDEIAALTKTSGVDLVDAFSQTGLQAHGLFGVMNLVAQATGGNVQQMQKLIPNMRGLLAEMVLTGNGSKDYAAILAQLYKAHGQTADAYARSQQTFSFWFGTLRNNAILSAVSLGQVLGPELIAIVTDIQHFAGAVNESIGPLGHFLDMNKGLKEGLEGVTGKLIEGYIAWRTFNSIAAATGAWEAFRAVLIATGFAAAASGAEAEAAQLKWIAMGNAIKAATVLGLAFLAEQTASDIGDWANNNEAAVHKLATAFEHGKISTDEYQRVLSLFPQKYRDQVVALVATDQATKAAAQAQHDAGAQIDPTTGKLVGQTEKLHLNADAWDRVSKSIGGVPWRSITGLAPPAGNQVNDKTIGAFHSEDLQAEIKKAQDAVQVWADVVTYDHKHNHDALAGDLQTLEQHRKTLATLQKEESDLTGSTKSAKKPLDDLQVVQASLQKATAAAYEDLKKYGSILPVHQQQIISDTAEITRMQKAIADLTTQALDPLAKAQKQQTDAALQIQKDYSTLGTVLPQHVAAYLRATDAVNRFQGVISNLAANRQFTQFGAAQAGVSGQLEELRHQSAMLGLSTTLSAEQIAIGQAQIQIEMDQRQTALDTLKWTELIAEHATKAEIAAAAGVIGADQNKTSEDRGALVKVQDAATQKAIQDGFSLQEAKVSGQIAELNHQSAMIALNTGMTSEQKAVAQAQLALEIDGRQIALDQLKYLAIIADPHHTKAQEVDAQNALHADENKQKEDQASLNNANATNKATREIQKWGTETSSHSQKAAEALAALENAIRRGDTPAHIEKLGEAAARAQDKVDADTAANAKAAGTVANLTSKGVALGTAFDLLTHAASAVAGFFNKQTGANGGPHLTVPGIFGPISTTVGQVNTFENVTKPQQAFDASQQSTQNEISDLEHQKTLAGLTMSLSPEDRKILQDQLQEQIDAKQILLDTAEYNRIVADKSSTPEQIAAALAKVTADKNRQSENKQTTSNDVDTKTQKAVQDGFTASEDKITSAITVLDRQSSLLQFDTSLNADQKILAQDALQIEKDQKQIDLDILKLTAIMADPNHTAAAVAAATKTIYDDNTKLLVDTAKQGADEVTAKLDELKEADAVQSAGIDRSTIVLQHASQVIDLLPGLSQGQRDLQKAQLQEQIDGNKLLEDQLKLAEIMADPNAKPSDILVAQNSILSDSLQIETDQLSEQKAQRELAVEALQLQDASLGRQTAYLDYQKAMIDATQGLDSTTKDAMKQQLQLQQDQLSVQSDTLKLQEVIAGGGSALEVYQAQTQIMVDTYKVNVDQYTLQQQQYAASQTDSKALLAEVAALKQALHQSYIPGARRNVGSGSTLNTLYGGMALAGRAALSG